MYLYTSMAVLVAAAEAIAVLSPVRPPLSSLKGHTIASLAIPDRAKAIFQRSCKDCHSRETAWPWYSRIQPIATLIQHDVSAGREHLDFSSWASDAAPEPASHNQTEEICDAVSKRSMPPTRYLLMHADARLSAQEIKAVCDWADSVQ